MSFLALQGAESDTFGHDEGFTKIPYLCIEPSKTLIIMLILTHIAAAIGFYLILENNPKIKKYVDAVFTLVEVAAGILVSKIKALFKKKPKND